MSELVPVAPVPPSDPPSDHGAFGVHGTGDTSGFGGLVRTGGPLLATERPLPDAFEQLYSTVERVFPQLGEAVERVVVDRGELTIHVKRQFIRQVCQVLRDDLGLRFEMCSSISGVDYLADPTGRRLHCVYHLQSMTHRRRVRLEVSVPIEDPHIPSVVSVYPTADYQERETWDMFGIIFDNHPALTRILMPDDWEGHPQRKDYPLGGVPVEYKGAQIPPPEERRRYG
ncbi:MAG: NADH-quinone oxidoreductase subunit C [Frankiaceae bacterium]